MTSPNTSSCGPISSFTLSGLHSLEDWDSWLGLLLLVMYVVAVVGNVTVLYAVKAELHQPMFILLFMLSAVELLIATAVMPRMLSLLWSFGRRISFDECLTQMFFLHFLSALESGTLVAMALDRYVAICHPLRYAAILTRRNVAKICLANGARGAAVMIPIPLIIKRLPLWRSSLLAHSYCLHQEVMRLACADIKVNVIYGMMVIVTVMGVDCLFISASYLLIIREATGLAGESNLKAAGTCSAHICAVLVYYVPLISLSVVHRLPGGGASNLQVLFGNIYLLLPPVINPLIYGIKTKQIRERLARAFRKGRGRGRVIPGPDPENSTGTEVR